MIREISVALAFGILTASTAFAEGAASTKFRLGFNTLSYSSASVEAKPDSGTSSKYSQTGLEMFNGGWELYIANGAWNFYLYPGQMGSGAFAGYSLSSSLEVGISEKMRSSKRDKPSDEMSAMEMGLYATYYQKLMEESTLELTLNPVIVSGSSKKTPEGSADATEVKTKESGMVINFSALFPYAITSNFHYYGCLAVAMDTRKESEAKMTNTSTTITVVPLGFRAYLN